ncbi:hypothetical protein [Treponema primitia]|uniref:hypothetical protein n=1 Tax=Treponema primitia TaxID=88058 RepID=UPI00025550A2|nr:hypothetical protein [Treponema primitia]
MVKGPWIINVDAMRCKNWVNGIEVVFHLDETGRPLGKIMPPPRGLSERIPQIQNRMIYVCRMWQRATAVFYKVYYRHLFREQWVGERQV